MNKSITQDIQNEKQVSELKCYNKVVTGVANKI